MIGGFLGNLSTITR